MCEKTEKNIHQFEITNAIIFVSIHVGSLVVEIVVSNDPLPWHYMTRSPAVAEKGDRATSSSCSVPL